MAVTVISIPNGDKLSEARKEQLMEDLKNGPVRKLTSEEREIYAHAIVMAVSKIPAFRDALALLRPYMDATASTAYTDPHARVGLSYWFFHLIDEREQMSVLLHECMHVLNNHFQRAEEVTSFQKHPEHMNVASDFEINTVLNRVRHVDISSGLIPDVAPYNYPPRKSMEQYAAMLLEDAKKNEENCPACNPDKNGKTEENESSQGNSGDKSDEAGVNADGDSTGDGQGEEGNNSSSGSSGDGNSDGSQGQASSESSSSSGGGAGSPGHTCGKGSGSSNGINNANGTWGCGTSSEATEAAADEAGIQRASDVEQTIVKQNTAARIVDERNREGRGLSEMNDFWDSILKHLAPPTVDWRKLLRSAIASSVDSLTKGRANYTYKRSSRRLQHPDFVFPGMVDYLPRIMIAVDTSGSMGNEDYQKALVEVEGIIKTSARGKDNVQLFPVDTKVGEIKSVSSAKKLRLSGGGGTIMAVAWKAVKLLPKKKQPDVLVLITDGGIDWYDVEKEVRSSKFNSVICVTQEYGYRSAPPSLKGKIPVLDISTKE